MTLGVRKKETLCFCEDRMRLRERNVLQFDDDEKYWSWRGHELYICIRASIELPTRMRLRNAWSSSSKRFHHNRDVSAHERIE